MAAWLLDPSLLTAPLSEYRATLAAPDRFNGLSGSESKNSLLGLDAVPGVLPGVDLAALLDKVLAGLGKAIEERAEKEATAFVLEQVAEKLCPNEGPSLRDWLPATCAAARAGAFSGGLGSGALASLALLQRSLEADLRGFPGRAAFLAVGRATGEGGWSEFKGTAEPTKQLVDDIVEGTHPLRALETYGTSLGELPSTKVKALGCVVSQPAARLRAVTAVEEAAQGMRPFPSRIEQSLASMLVSLQASACQGVLQTKANAAALKRWTEHLPELRASAVATAELLEELKKLSAPMPTTGTQPEKMAQIAREVALRTTTALDAVEVALTLVKDLGGDVEPKLRGALAQARGVVSLASTAMSGNLPSLFQELLMHQTSGNMCARAPCMTLPDQLLRYGGLVVAIVGAQSSDDVKAAVLAAASPAGTWRTKYRSEAAPVVTLGGMLGFGGSTDFKTGLTPRVVVPLGIDLSFAQSALFHFGVFAQLLDLAGYSSYVNHEGGVVRPFQSLSPGLHVRLGLFGAPAMLTAGFGYDADTGAATPGGAAWFRFGLSLDATLFLLYRR
ncbi:MAG: hypothetical protein HY901_33380 [Deltaproteobacteria bacterium]|nr:hypothetical protein [Deltaproteobacteria bacterium]